MTITSLVAGMLPSVPWASGHSNLYMMTPILSMRDIENPDYLYVESAQTALLWRTKLYFDMLLSHSKMTSS